ncbi:uncharacterized protein LOC143296002 [Babylonia areolata]|uniref:uncharacterized protein LOC143296002 n=1 Tax=Babylonia areolata TaxID=304850 RepID=UPI003FCF10FA
MGPVPKENQNSPADSDHPGPHSDPEELEAANHIIAAADASSSDDDGGGDSDGEGPAGQGYMLLPQDPDEEEGGGEGEGTIPSFPPLSALEGDCVSTRSLTEVRGAGLDLTHAVAEGNVHPAFAASFPDNKVPVHLQVPDLPQTKKDDVLWNQAVSESDRLQLDSAQLTKVKSAMVGFQLPKANIPDWACQLDDDAWKQQVLSRLTSPGAAGRPGVKEERGGSEGGEGTGTAHSHWPGTSGT